LGSLVNTRRLSNDFDLSSYLLTVDGKLELFERPLIFEDDQGSSGIFDSIYTLKLSVDLLPDS
jgi:hypothetical protein